MINKARLIKLARELIKIDSQNPPGDESRIGDFVKKQLQGLGLKPQIYEFKKNRPNVLATLAGNNKRRSLLITPHLDTVPAGKSWRADPFSAKIINGQIYGLGATDCKANLACALEVMQSLIEDGCILDYNLVFAATADEETGSALGLIPLLKKGILKPDAAVVLDSDDFHIIVSQKGLVHLKIKIQGKRAHGAYPWRGINAIDIALDVIREIKAHRFRSKKHKYLRPATINVGTIRGGDKVNIVADWCEFELDFRFLPGMSEKEWIAELQNTLRKHAKKSKIEIESIQDPYSIKENHPLVIGLKNAMRKMRIKPLIKGSEGATVITFFQHKNIPAVATGFGNAECAHIANEYVSINNLYKGALVLEEFLITPGLIG